MAKEFHEYLDEVAAERGEPTDWEGAMRLVQEAEVRLGLDRNAQYGTNNIALYGERGVVIRSSDKLQRTWTMIESERDDPNEKVEDSFADSANYGTYGVMLRRDWFALLTLPTATLEGESN